MILLLYVHLSSYLLYLNYIKSNSTNNIQRFRKCSLVYILYISVNLKLVFLQRMVSTLRKDDPRVEKTIKSFKEALIILLLKKEFERITVQEIADEANLNRVTFYLHFFDKEDLLEQILDKVTGKLTASIATPIEGLTYTSNQPAPILVEMCEHILKYATLYKVILVDENLPHYSRKITKIIEKSILESIRFYTGDGTNYTVPHKVIIAYTSSAYLGVIKWWIKNETPYTPKHLSLLLTQMAMIGPYEENPFVNQNNKN